MSSTVSFTAACVLFAVGLRLSAFFSGVETGFYRVSFLRLSIDAHAGDRVASRLLWFVRNPAYFVATTLIGNNVANYMTTAAIGLAAVTLFQDLAASVELIATIFLSPVVFVFGELIPKTLYFHSPTRLLRRDALWIELFFRVFLAVSFPLIWLTKWFQQVQGSDSRQLELVLGRSRLVQVLSEGYQQGILTDVQYHLVDGLMHATAQHVVESVIPSGRVLGVVDTATRDEVLEYARQYGVSNVAVRRPDGPDAWYAYYRVADVAISKAPLASIKRPMPNISRSCTKLEALVALRSAGEAYGIVVDGPAVIGVVNERGLVEQLFRPPQAATRGLSRRD